MRSAVLLAGITLLLAALAAYYASTKPADGEVIVPAKSDRLEEPTDGPKLRGSESSARAGPADSRSIHVAVVQEATGGRVPSAEITVIGEVEAQLLRVVTGESGLADVDVSPAARWLQVEHPAFHSKRVAVPSDRASRGTLRVPLVGRGSLTVSVVGADGPLSGAMAELDIVGYGPDSRLGPTRADTQGTARFASLPTGATVILTIQHAGYSTQKRRASVELDLVLTVRLEQAELLHLDVLLQGYESTVLPSHRVTLFHRTSDGLLSLIRNVDMVFRHGRSHVELEWDRGAETLVGQFKSPLDESRLWEAEARVEQVVGSSSKNGDAATSWKASLTFVDLGEALALRIVRTPEAGARGKEPVRNRLVCFARAASEVRGNLVTDEDGRCVVPVGGTVDDELRFWVPVEGLVSKPVKGLSAGPGDTEILVGAFGGDLVIRGWRGETDALTVEEVDHGRWPVRIFRPRDRSELAAHLPPGRYRVIAGRTPLGGFDYVVAPGQVTVAELPGASEARIRGSVVAGGVQVELLRSPSTVELPALFQTTRSAATGKFSFDGLPSGRYVVTSRDHEGRPFWHSLELADAETRDLGTIGPDEMREVEIRLVHADGAPVSSQGVILWEAPKGSGIKLRLSPDPEGVIHARVRGEGPLAVFGPGWAAALPAGVSPLTIRVPAGEQDGHDALPIDLVSPRQRQVILVSAGLYGALGTVCRVTAEGTVAAPLMSKGGTRYLWDEGWAFYRIEDGRAARPPKVLIPAEYIPTEAHSCRVVLIAAGGLDLSPLGWNRAYALPWDAASAGLTLSVAAGWDLRVEFLGVAGRSVELSTRGSGASIREVR